MKFMRYPYVRLLQLIFAAIQAVAADSGKEFVVHAWVSKAFDAEFCLACP